MPMYAMLSTLGPDGWETLRQHPERILAVKAEVEAMGLKVHAQYALMGQYDFLNMIEAPDEQSMAKAAITLAARGLVRIDARRSGRYWTHHVPRRRSSRRSSSSNSTGRIDPSDRRRTLYCGSGTSVTRSTTSKPRVHAASKRERTSTRVPGRTPAWYDRHTVWQAPPRSGW
jgi:uncharacterized protein with GYD domain